MAKTFDIPFSGDPATLFQHAKKAAGDAQATLTGDTKHGKFSGKGIEGNYEVGDNVVHVTITKKPPVIADSVIESQLQKFFEGS